MRFATAFAAIIFAPVLAFPQTAGNQDSAASAATTILVGRAAMRTDSPHASTYHLAEFMQLRGGWVYPDIGYVDFGHGNYRELWIGAGRTLVASERASFTAEMFFAQALGAAARSACYLQPWTLLSIRPTSRITSETSYFAYLPLNEPARVQHVLERSKLEYRLNRRWKLGSGYAGYKYGDSPWQNKPFVTGTFSTSAGSLEIWFQKVPSGAQIQLRMVLEFQ